MTQYENIDSEAQKKPGAVKKTVKAVFAVAVSAGLVGTFALPAYSNPGSEPVQFSSQAPQTLTAVNAPAAELIVEALAVGENLELKEREALQEQRIQEEQERLAQERAASLDAQSAFGVRNDIPAGAGAGGVAASALAQLGMYQDCTALVENALRSVGYGVGDLGTQIGEWAQYGSMVSGNLAPGDILVWPGRHVAVYIGNGQAVHGGYGGNQTVVAGAYIDGNPGGVIRVG